MMSVSSLASDDGIRNMLVALTAGPYLGIPSKTLSGVMQNIRFSADAASRKDVPARTGSQTLSTLQGSSNMCICSVWH